MLRARQKATSYPLRLCLQEQQKDVSIASRLNNLKPKNRDATEKKQTRPYHALKDAFEEMETKNGERRSGAPEHAAPTILIVG